VIQNARKYLISLQVGDAQVASTNSAFVGGIGYGGTNRLPDLFQYHPRARGDLR